ncbi:MAG: class I SAM-dependent methyltransferase [Bacilli bacterium]
MGDHYYTNKPGALSKEQQYRVAITDQVLSFTTDAGVFSKGGLDFGTRVLLENMTLDRDVHDVADVGCGYGPIGIYLAKKYGVRVWMYDVNTRALGLAERNATNNGARERVVIEESSLLEVAERDELTFDVIVSNPPIRAGKEIVHGLFEQASRLLRANGTLWIVIQKKQGAPSAIKKLESLFAEVDIIAKEKGYFIIQAKKDA